MTCFSSLFISPLRVRRLNLKFSSKVKLPSFSRRGLGVVDKLPDQNPINFINPINPKNCSSDEMAFFLIGKNVGKYVERFYFAQAVNVKLVKADEDVEEFFSYFSVGN